MKRAVLLLPFLAATASAGLIDMNGKPIDEWTTALELRLWRDALEGDIKVDDDILPGTSVDIEEGLNITDEEEDLEYWGAIRAKRTLIRAKYYETTFSESETISETFAFDGSMFTVSETVDAELTFRVGGADVEYLLVDTGSAAKFGLEIGLGVGARYLSVSARIASETTGISERSRKNTVVPVISASASVGIANIVRLDAEVGGLWFDYLGLDGVFIDASIEGKVYLYQYLYAGIGWRYTGLDFEYKHGDDIDLNLSINGFFISVGTQF